MAIGLGAPLKRVFIIGPMNDDLDESGLSNATHIPNIAAATRRVLAQHTANGAPEWDVIIPPNHTGDIPPHIFANIMHCDIAIADLSNASPNVFYELAILHANGIPVILLTERDTEDKQPKNVFYTVQSNLTVVDDYSEAAIERALITPAGTGAQPVLEQLAFAQRNVHRSNPISNYFGGVHLINVASTTGLATGQFYNFLQWALREGGIFQDFPELEGLIILRPARVSEVDRATGTLIQRFGDEITDNDDNPVMDDLGRSKKEIKRQFYPHKGHPRGGYFFQRIGNYLIDYPTPISSLSVSQQYRAAADYVRDYAEVDDDDGIAPIEARLIEIYFETLRRLANDPANGCSFQNVRILTLEEAIAVLDTQAS
ncbi:hypothetical protein C1J03_18575 [Sulfitobacter sp. SK012]|nr:hypothetical protein C1J03_18575 [Sulfitobacter sp. SK012]